MAKTIHVKNAPDFELPYSHAIKVGDFVYISGQVGVDPETLEVVGDTIEEQTEQCIKNIETILKQVNITLDHVIKINAYVANSSDIPNYNNVYKKMFNAPYPARTTVPVELEDYLIEIDCIAYCKAERS